MSKLQDFRSKYPQYKDIPDEELAKALHQKYYSNVPYEQYAARLGVGTTAPPVAPAPPKEMPKGSSFVRGLRDPIDAGAQFLPRALSFITSLGGNAPNAISKFLDSEARRVDKLNLTEEQKYQALRDSAQEKGFDWGRLTGNVVNPINLAAGAGAANAAGRAGVGVMGQAAAAGAAGGLLTPVTDTENFATEKLQQVGLGAAFAPITQKLTAGAGRMLSPLVDAAEQRMRDLGVRLTPGMSMGGKFNTAEEFLQYMPLIGGRVQDARQRAVFDFNKAMLNKTLDKVGQKLPEDVIGRDAIAYVGDQISTQYDDVLSKMNWQLDKKTGQELLTTLQGASKKLNKEQAAKLEQIVRANVVDKIKGGVTGDSIKTVESEMGKLIKDYTSSGSAVERELGQELVNVNKVLRTSLERQNPKFVKTLRKVDSAKADLYRIEQAAATTNADNGVFSPKAFQQAVRQKDPTRNKRAFARGEARLQEESDAAMDILADKAGATLEGRLGLTVGGGYAALNNPVFGIPAALGLGALYSPSGINVANTLMTTRPEAAKLFGTVLQQQSPIIGGTVAPFGLFNYNLEDRKKE